MNHTSEDTMRPRAERATGESTTLDAITVALVSAALEITLTVDSWGDRILSITFNEHEDATGYTMSGDNNAHIERLQALARAGLEHLSRQDVDRAIEWASTLRERLGEDPLPEHFIGGHRDGGVADWYDALDEGPSEDLPDTFTGEVESAERPDGTPVRLVSRSLHVTVRNEGYTLNDTQVEIESTCEWGHLATITDYQDSRRLVALCLFMLSDDDAEAVLRDFDSVEGV